MNLLAELLPHRRALARIGAWSVVQALPALVSGRIIAFAVDRGFTAGRPATGVAWLAALALVYLISAAGTRNVCPHLGTVVEAVRDTLVRRVVAGTVLGAAHGRQAPDASAVTRLTEQVETVRDVLAGLLLVTLQFAITIVATLAGLATLGSTVLLVTMPPVGASLAGFAALIAVLARRQRAVILTQEAVAATVTPILAATRDITAFGAERHALAAGDAVFARSRAATAGAARIAALRALAVTLGCNVPVAVLILAAPWLARQGVTLGGVVGAAAYLTVNVEPMLRSLVATLGGSSLRLVVTLSRIAEMSRLPRPRPVRGLAPGRDGIELREVSFAYGPHSEPVVRDLSLRIPDNDHLVIVGASGIGKSTLALLIAGLERPQHGTVLLGGVPLDAVDPRRARQLIALIPQESYVFAGSLRDNLAYLTCGVPDGELDRAAAEVGAAALVRRLGGYGAEITPVALSAGERQLIALVRAYVAPARIVILDEATCHLDPAAEAAAEQAFARRPGTLIVIAHRISSAERASRVLLLDGGGARLGTHQELRVSSPGYADMAGLWAQAAPDEAEPGAAVPGGETPGGETPDVAAPGADVRGGEIPAGNAAGGEVLGWEGPGARPAGSPAQAARVVG